MLTHKISAFAPFLPNRRRHSDSQLDSFSVCALFFRLGSNSEFLRPRRRRFGWSFGKDCCCCCCFKPSSSRDRTEHTNFWQNSWRSIFYCSVARFYFLLLDLLLIFSKVLWPKCEKKDTVIGSSFLDQVYVLRWVHWKRVIAASAELGANKNLCFLAFDDCWWDLHAYCVSIVIACEHVVEANLNFNVFYFCFIVHFGN